jgi:hypothetical protein
MHAFIKNLKFDIWGESPKGGKKEFVGGNGYLL